VRLSVIALAAVGCYWPHAPAPTGAPDAAPPDPPVACSPGTGTAYTVVALGAGTPTAVDGLAVGGNALRGQSLVSTVWTVDPMLMDVDQVELPDAQNVDAITGTIAVGNTLGSAAAWTLSATGASPPQLLPAPADAPTTVAVAGDGTTAVGYATGETAEAVAWALGGSAVTLQVLPPLAGFSAASTVAITGDLVVGTSQSEETTQLTAWTLPAATAAAIPSGAFAPSSLGLTTAGPAALAGLTVANGYPPVVWPIGSDGSIGAPVMLDLFPGDTSSTVDAVTSSAAIGISQYVSKGGNCARLVQWAPGSDGSWTPQDITPSGLVMQVGAATSADAAGDIATVAAFADATDSTPQVVLLVPF
jgi:hypothetical protein